MHSKEKDEACLGFLEEIFTKSVHRGGVPDDKVANTNLSVDRVSNTNLSVDGVVQCMSLKATPLRLEHSQQIYGLLGGTLNLSSLGGGCLKLSRL